MIPLIGLPHYIDVIRYVGVADSMGGVSKGSPITIYSDRNCRFSLWDGEEVQPKVQGFVGPQEYKVLMVYSPLILDSDFLKVAYGTIPNVGGGPADGFSPKIDISTPDGDKTLTWKQLDSNGDISLRYSDDNEEYVVSWDGSTWNFEDTNQSADVSFDGYEYEHNIFNLDWSVLVGSDYSVDNQYGDYLYFRILEKDHKFDHRGVMHHTTLRVEEEEEDG